MTFDYGVRFLLVFAVPPAGQPGRDFDPSRYDPSQAPRLYYPATVNGTQGRPRSYDGPDGESDLYRHFRAWNGQSANGMVLQADAGVPKGSARCTRRSRSRGSASPGISQALARPPALERGPLPQGASRRRIAGNLAANPPFIHNPVVFNGSFESLLRPE